MNSQKNNRLQTPTPYLATLTAQHESLVLPTGTARLSLALDGVFQPLRLRRDPAIAGDLDRLARRPLLGEASDSATITVPRLAPLALGEVAIDGREALAQTTTRRMVVLGGPGTGKTTLLKHLLLQAIQQAQAEAGAPIPLFIALPDLARSGLSWPDYLVWYGLALGGDATWGERFAQASAQGNVFACLDSLDEVAPADRPAILTLLQRLTGQGGTWIVGSRFADYKGGQLGPAFAEWELTALDHPLRLRLAHRLLPALGVGGVPAQAERFVADLEAHPRAAAWGENPLLVSLAAVVFARQGALPAGRAALYAEVLDASLAARTPDPSARAALHQPLAAVALHLYQQGRRTFTRADLEASIAAVLPPPVPTDLVDTIIVSGALEVVAQATYAFRHQTFHEYLAALALAQDVAAADDMGQARGWALAWSKRTYSRWTEILRLMVGNLVHDHGVRGREQAWRWLTALVGEAETPEGDPGSLCLGLALRSLVELGNDVLLAEPERAGAIVERWADRYVDSYFNQSYHETYRRLAEELHALPLAIVQPAISRLIAALDQVDVERQQKIIAILGALGPHAPIATFTELFQAGILTTNYVTKQRQFAVYEAILASGKYMPLDLLISLFSLPIGYYSYVNVINALKVHGEVGEQRAREVLREKAKEPGKEQEILKCWAILGGNEALSVLLAALENDSPDIRRAAISAATHQPTIRQSIPMHLIVRELQSDDFSSAGAALGFIEKDASRFLIEPLMELLDNSKLRNLVISTLPAFNERAPLDLFIQGIWEGKPSETNGKLRAIEDLWHYYPYEKLRDLLHHPDGAVRSRMSAILAHFGKNQALNDIIVALDDPQESVRLSACHALGKMETSEAIPYLKVRLTDSAWNVREQAAIAITKLGEPGQYINAETMLEAFNYCDDRLRADAIKLLGILELDAYIPLFIEMTLDSDSGVAAAAFGALAKFGDTYPRAIIEAGLHHESNSVRSRALLVAAKRKDMDVLSILFQESNLFEQYGFITIPSVLATINDKAVIPLYILAMKQQLVLPQLYDNFQRFATHLSLDDFQPLLDDSDPKARAEGLKGLAFIVDKLDPEMIMPYLHDKNKAVRLAAFQALGAFKERAPLELLLNLAQEDPNNHAAISGLIIIGTPLALQAVLTLLPQMLNPEDTAEKLIEYASKIELAEVLPWKDSSRGVVRAALALLLGALGTEAPVPVLLDLLHEDDPHVARIAAQTLVKLSSIINPDILRAEYDRASDELKHQLGVGVAQQGGEIDIDMIIEAITDLSYDDESSHSAVKTLSTLGTRVNPAKLLPLLADEDCDFFETFLPILKQHHRATLLDLVPECEQIIRHRRAGNVFSVRVAEQLAQAIQGMKPVPPIFFEVLSTQLDHPVNGVRLSATYVLRDIARNVPDSIIRKLYVLRHDPLSGRVREAAESALAAILATEGIEDA